MTAGDCVYRVQIYTLTNEDRIIEHICVIVGMDSIEVFALALLYVPFCKLKKDELMSTQHV